MFITYSTKCLNFFFSPPAHLCAVTYVTEISLIVTLKSQFALRTLPEFCIAYNQREKGCVDSYRLDVSFKF